MEMTMRFSVEIAVKHESGKFCSKSVMAEEIADEIENMIFDVDASGHDDDGSSEYEVVSTSAEYVYN